MPSLNRSSRTATALRRRGSELRPDLSRLEVIEDVGAKSPMWARWRPAASGALTGSGGRGGARWLIPAFE
jgi:hypothetical protein